MTTVFMSSTLSSSPSTTSGSSPNPSPSLPIPTITTFPITSAPPTGDAVSNTRRLFWAFDQAERMLYNSDWKIYREEEDELRQEASEELNCACSDGMQRIKDAFHAGKDGVDDLCKLVDDVMKTIPEEMENVGAFDTVVEEQMYEVLGSFQKLVQHYYAIIKKLT